MVPDPAGHPVPSCWLTIDSRSGRWRIQKFAGRVTTTRIRANLPGGLVQLAEANVAIVQPRAVVLQAHVPLGAVDAWMRGFVLLLLVEVRVADDGIVERYLHLPPLAQNV